jgi:hypothetical protein
MAYLGKGKKQYLASSHPFQAPERDFIFNGIQELCHKKDL